jgi:hypothetical protein
MNERKSAMDRRIEGNLFTRDTIKMVTFDEYYPGVKSINVNFYESGRDTHGHDRNLSNQRVAPIIRCSNKLCSDGGFEIEDVIFNMIREKEAHREIQLTCIGQETSLKGRKVYGRCENEGQFVIDIVFKDDLG